MISKSLDLGFRILDFRSRLVLGLLLLAASWRIWVWYGERMLDGADEPFGILALVVALGFAWRRELLEAVSWRRMLGFVGVLGVYSFFDDRVSLLVSAGFVVLALAMLWGRREGWLGHWGLFALSLPLIASLQFYGGFPIRWVVGKVCSGLLNLVGVEVTAVGTALHWRGEMVIIDAPCSGIQMLWMGAFFSCVIICQWKLDTWKSFKLLQFAGLAVFAANVLRNFSLFFLETEIIRAPEWGHSGVGLGFFGLALWGIWKRAERLVKVERGANDEGEFVGKGRAVSMGRDLVLD